MKVRMLVDALVDAIQYRGNQVVELPDATAKRLIENGEADGHKDAVAYCLDALKAEVIVHPGAEVAPTKRKKG